MSFEGANRTFSSIASVDIGWDELVVALPLLFDDTFVVCAGFVVKNLKVNTVAAVLEALHDGVVVFNVVGIFFGLEGAWRIVLESQW